MAQLQILIEGYARRQGNGWQASPATVLIQDQGLSIVVDPGADQKLLYPALQRHNLTPEAIDMVFLTHYHLDHLFNLRCFPRACLCNGTSIIDDQGLRPYSEYLPGTEVRVLPTSGHTLEHASLLVPTAQGIIALAGDVFWWTTDQEQKTDRASLLQHQDMYAYDTATLLASRRQLLELADFIIPGHGKMFRVVAAD